MFGRVVDTWLTHGGVRILERAKLELRDKSYGSANHLVRMVSEELTGELRRSDVDAIQE